VADRKAQKLVGKGWVDVPFEGLRAGDRFQLFEPDGTFVCEADALGDSYPSADGLWTIHCIEHRRNPSNLCADPLPIENWHHG